jgi:hypothetical protein
VRLQARAPRGGQAGLQLEPLLGDDADADGSLCHHQLAAAVMALLCTPSAEPLLQALRPQLTSFVSTAVRRSQVGAFPRALPTACEAERWYIRRRCGCDGARLEWG